MVSDKGGTIEVAVVVDGTVVVFDMTRRVAAELAATITGTLALPYFIEASPYSKTRTLPNAPA